ncbi:hypothetical protein EJV47_14710 [Hymenobacter gummosus]|uniref:Outer membrane protein beta-barrel domain-containing protein n=1 Tax=Hymenobacter gummosus TaxID=1776032 RepID=A0A431U198_9BACT|nr:hypothetical protein [Hymenobacter gummosus]RTQ48847.1 hypothetical protein EJV47_14710 [Hymenobacter gummosus]
MTEREPDHLFDELRRKLEDYGSHPSADLWAGLEQHLAAQPAAPQRQWRRVALWLAAACLLLLLSIPALLWLRPAAPTVATTETAGPATGTAAARSQPVPATGAPSRAHLATAAQTSAAQLPQPASTLSPNPTSAQRATDTAPPAPSAPAANAGTSAASPAAQTRAGRSVATAAGSTKPDRPTDAETTGLVAAGRPGRKQARRLTTAVAGGALGRAGQGPHPSVSATTPGPAEPNQAASGLTRTATGRPQPTTSAATPGGGSNSSAATAAPTTAAPTHAAGSPDNSAAAAASTAAPTTSAGSTASEDLPLAAAGRPAALPTTPPVLATDKLNSRSTALLTPVPGLPAPLNGVAADTTRRRPRPAGRWSLALLGGAGVAYRQLGPARDSASRGLGRLERPAISYAAQLQVGYALTPRLCLSTGLGYTEYATRLNAVLNKPRIVSTSSIRVLVYDNGTRRDTLIYALHRDSLMGTDRVALRQRDTYRFVTVPLLAQYHLGTTGRLRYDVLGGAALGLYAGGRTSSGSACACEQVAGRTGPGGFRVASLLLTLGAAAEYQWRPGWHLQLQPVLQYSASSITQVPRPARRPVALFFQTGLRFDLP